MKIEDTIFGTIGLAFGMGVLASLAMLFITMAARAVILMWKEIFTMLGY